MDGGTGRPSYSGVSSHQMRDVLDLLSSSELHMLVAVLLCSVESSHYRWDSMGGDNTLH